MLKQKNIFLPLSLLFCSFFVSSCNTINESEWAENIGSDVIVMDVQADDDEMEILNQSKFSNTSIPAKLYFYDKESGSQKMVPANLEAQGAGSRYFTKWGYTFSIGEKKTVQGLNKFNLSIQAYDKSLMRTALASYMFEKAGFDVFKSDYAFLKINDKTEGLYVMTERVEEDYFEKRSLPVSELVKVVFGAKFTYESMNHLSDNFEKKIPDDDNYNNLADFIYFLDNISEDSICSNIGTYLNLRQYLTYHAICTIINNSDGLTNNFYLYRRSNNSPYEIIPWDFDKTFDPKQDMDIMCGNDIVKKLFKDEKCISLYRSIVRDLLDNVFTEAGLFPVIEKCYGRINEVYYKDPYLGAGGNSLESEVVGLKSFITKRRNQLLNGL